MKKLLSLLLSFCIFFSSVSAASALEIELPKNLEDFTEGVTDLISEYEELTSDDAMFFTADDEGASENTEGTNRLIVKSSKRIDTLNAINSVSGYNDLYILQFENATDCEAAIEYYSSLSCVEYVQEDGILTETAIEETEDTFSEAAIGISSQYQSDVFGYTNAKANMGSAEVTVAVVDTGVQNDHDYLQGRVEPTGFDSVYNESCYDKRGHGTHVAGIIVANTKSNVKIKPYKVIGDDGTGTDTQLYLGIQAAIEDGVDIINLSLTRKGESEVVHEALVDAYNAGITVVAAAGNDNANLNEIFYTPACYDEVICVVNVDINKKRSSTSNWRFNDTLSAPGVDILSSYVGNTYKVMSGTSMAAPFITCCVAYLLASGKYYSPEEAYNTLYANSKVGATASIHYVVPGAVINSTSTCATPVFTYDTGTFSGYLDVKLTCATPGATIMYRTSDMNSNTYYEYTGPVRIEKNATFNAYAFCRNYKTSGTASVTYTKSDMDTSMFIIDENDTLIGYTGTATTVTVPGYFDGGAVLKIAASAFSGNTNITKITLNKATTTIGEGAFEGCTALTSVSGTGVTEIEEDAFKDCTSLTTVTMSALLTIGDRAFSGCTALTTLKLSKLNTIGAYAFENSGINTLTATRLTTIGNGAFCGSAIKSVSLSAVTTIEDNAFENCDNLTEITLTNRITALGNNVYQGCKNLASVTLEGITTLGNGTFKDCTALTTITASSLNSIGDYTFSGCTALDTFDIAHLTTVGNYSFFGCKALKAVNSEVFPSLSAIGDYAFAESGIETFVLSINNNFGYKAIGDCAALNLVSLPAITEFDAEILEGSTNLKKLMFQKATVFDFGEGKLSDYFPNLESFTAHSLRELPDYFFEGCDKLSEVSFSGVETIGAYAFSGTAIKSISLSYANTFGDGAFADMPSLESVTLSLPDSIDFSIFKGSTNVKHFSMKNLRQFSENFRCYDIFPNIESFSCNAIDIPDYAFKGCSSLADYDFFDVETVGYEAFCGTAVNDPYFSDVLFIGERAFADCTNLGDFSVAGLVDINMNIFENSEHTVTDLNLNYITFEESPNYGKLNFQKFINLETIGINKLKDIPSFAFRNLSKLNQVYLGDCETIGAYAFENCTSLKNFEFSNIKTIGSRAFAGCTGLESFKANKLTSFAADAFTGCSGLKTMDLGNISKLPVDGNGRFHLAGVDNLESLTANSIETIPDNFLKGYKKLNTVSFKSADDIGDYAFYDTSLSSYTIPDAQTVGDYAFYGTNIETVDFTEITAVGSYAFADCDKLEEVNISYQITVGDGAFANCDELSAITLSDVKDIPANVIEGCPKIVVIEFNQITELPVAENGTSYVSDKPLLNEFLVDYVTSVPDDYFINNPELYSVYMPSLEYVGDRAFMNTSIQEFPSDYIVSIGDYAFSGTGLKKAYNNCVEEVGDYAFKDCKALTKAKIYNENGDFTLGVGVFENCTSLTGVALYKDEVDLPAYTFKNCSRLNQVHNKATFGVYDPEILLNIKSIGDEAFYGCESMSFERIKLEDIEYLGDNSLVGVQNTLDENTELVLPKLKYLGENAFGDAYMFRLALENVEVVKDLPDCAYAVIGSDIKEFSCNRTEPLICAYEDSVVADFCRENGMNNFRAYNGTDAIYYDVDSALTEYEQVLMFYPMGFDLTYEWYACNKADRSDSVLIKTTLEYPFAINPMAQFAQNNLENKYKYFYCVATSTENGNVLKIQSRLCRNVFANIKGTEDTTIDFNKGLIYTHSINNINTLENVFTVNGDVRITPSHKNGADNYYGTGTVVELVEGDNVAFTQTLVVFGDVNGDGIVDVLDACEIERASNDNSALEGHYEAAADINLSGEIDVLDYQASINKALAS